MPTVPKIDGGGVTQNVVNPGQVNQNINLSAERIGSALSGVADAIQKEKDRADRIQVMNAERQITEWETQKVYSKDGALNKKGKDSFDLPNQINEDYDKSYNEIANGLNNDRQRFMFNRIAAERKQSIDRTIERHVSTEIREYDAQETDAYIKSQRERAFANPYDQGVIDGAINSQVIAVAKFAEDNGLGPEYIKQKLQDVEGQTHAAVISRMINQDNDLAADEYYKKNKDRLGKYAADVEKEVEHSSLRGNSQRNADVIWKSAKSYGDAIEKAKEIESPKLRDATIDRIGQLNQQKRINDSEREKQYNIFSTNIIDKTGSTDGIPRSIWNTFSNTERASLEAYANMRRGGKEKQENDPYIYDDLRNLKTIAPDKFMEIDFTNAKYLSGLKPGTREQFVKEQAEMRSGKKSDGSMSDISIMNESLKLMKIKPDSEDGITFKRMVDDRIEEFSKSNGKKPSNKELREITDALSVEVITDKGILWDSKKRLFQLKGNDPLEGIDIRPKDKANVENFLKKKGIPATDKNVQDYYKLMLEQQGFLNAK